MCIINILFIYYYFFILFFFSSRVDRTLYNNNDVKFVPLKYIFNILSKYFVKFFLFDNIQDINTLDINICEISLKTYIYIILYIINNIVNIIDILYKY